MIFLVFQKNGDAQRIQADTADISNNTVVFHSGNEKVAEFNLDNINGYAKKWAAGAIGWQSVEFPLGELPTLESLPTVYHLPSAIPETATEILVYAFIATGSNPPPEFGGTYEIAVDLTPNGDKAAFKLYYYAYDQNSWSYNSENFWLPVPFDREIRVQLNGTPFKNGNRQSGLAIIGYR